MNPQDTTQNQQHMSTDSFLYPIRLDTHIFHALDLGQNLLYRQRLLDFSSYYAHHEAGRQKT